MSSDIKLKEIVRNKYAEIALHPKSSCCSDTQNSCCGTETAEFSEFNDDYSNLDGYVAEADLNLGCGLPTKYSGIKPGDTVVDLGSGAGNDVFIARQLVGENGKVIGVDMTPEMIQKAIKNKRKNYV